MMPQQFNLNLNHLGLAGSRESGVGQNSLKMPLRLVSDTHVPVLPVEKGSGAPTLGDIKRAIPAELFERSLAHSLLHLASDIIQAAGGFAFALLLVERMESPVAFWAFYALYWAWQGPTLTGLWVLAHECGHGGFSDYVSVRLPLHTPPKPPLHHHPPIHVTTIGRFLFAHDACAGTN